MPSHKPTYQIQRTEEFIEATHELTKIYKRFPDLVKAIDWALCRKPHAFIALGGGYYLWVTEELTNTDFPTVRIVYKINESDSVVVLLSIDDIVK